MCQYASWLKPADCKSALMEFVGSNPTWHTFLNMDNNTYYCDMINIRMFLAYYTPLILCVIYSVWSIALFALLLYVITNPNTFRLHYLYIFASLRFFKIFVNGYIPYVDRKKYLGILLA